MPWPVTQPIRGAGKSVAELRADLAIGGDAAGVVVGGAGDEAGAEAAQEILLLQRVGGGGLRCDDFFGHASPTPAGEAVFRQNPSPT
jgi:hypothetical protein